MSPGEERVLGLALLAMTDDDAIGPLQDAILEDDFAPSYAVSTFPRPMPLAFYDVHAKRRWVARTIAAVLLFEDWPTQWPLAVEMGANPYPPWEPDPFELERFGAEQMGVMDPPTPPLPTLV